MNAKKTPVKIEMVADVAQTPGGDLVIRPRPGRSLKLNRVAETIRQADGAYRLKPHGEWIGMSQAMTILDFPYNTLLRAMKSRALAAYAAGRAGIAQDTVRSMLPGLAAISMAGLAVRSRSALAEKVLRD